MNYDECDDYDDYNEEDDDDLEALLVMGMLHDEEVRRSKNSGGGCLTAILMFVLIPISLLILALKA